MKTSLNFMKNREIVIIIFLILILVSISLPKIFQFPFFDDEAFTYTVSSNSISGIIDYLKGDIAAPLFYVICSFLLGIKKGFPIDIEPFLRLPFLLIGLINILLFYAFSRLWFNKNHSIPAALFFSISYITLNFSTVARFYSLILFLSILGYYSVERFIRKPGFNWMLLFFVTNLINIYIHYYTFVFFLTQCAYFIFIAFFSRQNTNLKKSNKVYFIIIISTICLLTIPAVYMILQQPKIFEPGSLKNWVEWRIRAAGSAFLMFAGTRNYQPVMLLSLFPWIFAFMGLITIKKKYRGNLFIFLAAGISMFALSLVAPSAKLGSRYFIGFFPLYILCLISGFFHINEKFKLRKFFQIIIFIFLLFPSLYNFYLFSFIQKSPFERFDTRNFVNTYFEQLKKKPELITNYEKPFRGGRYYPAKRVLVHYFYFGRKDPKDFPFLKVFSKRTTLSFVKNNPLSVTGNPLMTILYPSNRKIKDRPGWEYYEKSVYVKFWPADTEVRTVINEIEEMGFDFDLGNI